MICKIPKIIKPIHCGNNRILKIVSLTFPNDYTLLKNGITQSLLSTFQRCRQEFLLSVNRWEPVIPPLTPLFGSCIHYCLDRMYFTAMEYHRNSLGETPIPTPEEINTYIIECNVQFKDEIQMVPPEKWDITKVVMYCLLTEYVKYYRNDFIENKFDSVERISQVTLNNTLLRRKTDGILISPQGKWILEHKTMSQINLESILLRITFDFQNLFYIISEELEFPQVPVSGVIYNIIRNPSSRPRKTETLYEFQERFRMEIRSHTEYYFLRYQLPYTTSDKTLFKNELLEKIEEVHHLLFGALPIYRNHTACVGRSECKYLPACSSGTLSGYRQRHFLFPELEV